MTEATALAALDRIDSDDALAERIGEADPDAALELLRAEGFDVTREEMRDAIVNRYGHLLTQEELDAIAGGDLGGYDMAIIDKVGGLFLFLLG